jgi:carbamate kinase
MTAEVQRSNVRSAEPAPAAVTRDHQLMLSHGKGPQVGLALQGAAYEEVEAYPLEVQGAQTKGNDRVRSGADARQPAAVLRCRSRPSSR